MRVRGFSGLVIGLSFARSDRSRCCCAVKVAACRWPRPTEEVEVLPALQGESLPPLPLLRERGCGAGQQVEGLPQAPGTEAARLHEHSLQPHGLTPQHRARPSSSENHRLVAYRKQAGNLETHRPQGVATVF